MSGSRTTDESLKKQKPARTNGNKKNKSGGVVERLGGSTAT